MTNAAWHPRSSVAPVASPAWPSFGAQGIRLPSFGLRNLHSRAAGTNLSLSEGFLAMMSRRIALLLNFMCQNPLDATESVE